MVYGKQLILFVLGKVHLLSSYAPSMAAINKFNNTTFHVDSLDFLTDQI